MNHNSVRKPVPDNMLQGSNRRRYHVLQRILVLCSGLFFAMPDARIFAQDVNQEEGSLEEVVVYGIRESIQRAVETKRNADQVKDAVTAEDIGKLPDQNLAEALQRITGVQIGRDFGEGNSIQVRGLPQNRIELNGQTLVGSSADSRGIQFNDLAPDTFRSLEVIKSPMADQTEGALGATINLISRRPFDSAGRVLSGRLAVEHNEDQDTESPNGSLFFSDRWNAGEGEMGVTVALNYSDKDTRRDTSEARWYVNRNLRVSGVPASEQIYVPQQLREQYWAREQERYGINSVFQWHPTDSLEIIVDGNYNRFDIGTVSQVFLARGNQAGPVEDAVLTDDNTLLSGLLLPTQLYIPGWDQRSDRTTWGLSAAFTLEQEKWELSGNFSKSGGENIIDNIFFNLDQGPFSNRNSANPNPRLRYTVNSDIPTSGLAVLRGDTELDLTDRSTYGIQSLRVQHREHDSGNLEARLDFDFHVDFRHITTLEAGIRVAERTAKRDLTGSNNIFRFRGGAPLNLHFDADDSGRTTANELGLSSHPEVPTISPPSNFLDDFGGGVGSISVDASGFYNNPALIQEVFGVDRTDFSNPPTTDIVGFHDITEDTVAAYLKANFEGDWGRFPYRANVGVRYVNTDIVANGKQVGQSGNNPNAELNRTVTPIEGGRDYNDLLPSGNIRMILRDDLYLRLAAARVMSRPNPTSLSPGTRLNVGSDTGSRGNPELEPFRATQYDISLEWYLSETDFVSFALFYKDVESFISSVVVTEVISDPTRGDTLYNITTSENGQGGKVKGVEFGFSKFLDFLPAPFDGFGVSVNYTYADSETPNNHPVTGSVLPLEDLSENSYNLVGFYENDKISARLAWNWRSEFLDQTSGLNNQPLFEEDRGQLDFSASYAITQKVKLNFEAINLNDSYIERYSSLSERLAYVSTSGRRFVLSVSARL